MLEFKCNIHSQSLMLTLLLCHSFTFLFSFEHGNTYDSLWLVSTYYVVSTKLGFSKRLLYYPLPKRPGSHLCSQQQFSTYVKMQADASHIIFVMAEQI